jgi:hypothetical protein
MARAKLSGALLAQKGAAAPTATHSDVARQSASPRAPEGEGGKPIALTLKVDQARYETLKVLGARTRRSNQEILLAALDAYLARVR